MEQVAQTTKTTNQQSEASAVVPQIAAPHPLRAGDRIVYKFLLNDCSPDERVQWFIGTVSRKTGKEKVRYY